MKRYYCNECSFQTDVRVTIKDHAAMLGHFGWTDTEQEARCVLCSPDVESHSFIQHLATRVTLEREQLGGLLRRTFAEGCWAAGGCSDVKFERALNKWLDKLREEGVSV